MNITILRTKNPGKAKGVNPDRKTANGAPTDGLYIKSMYIPTAPATPMAPSCIDASRSLGYTIDVKRGDMLYGQQPRLPSPLEGTL